MAELRSTSAVSAVPVEDLAPIDVVKTTARGVSYLRGSACPACGQAAFPPRNHCSRCHHSPQDEVSLSREGSLYAFSTVHVSSAEEVPYTLGFIDLPGDLRVLSKLFGSPDAFRIGDTVRVAVQDDDWGFEKSDEGAVSDG